MSKHMLCICVGGVGGVGGGQAKVQRTNTILHTYLSESKFGQWDGGVAWDCTRSRKNVFTSFTLRVPGRG